MRPRRKDRRPILQTMKQMSRNRDSVTADRGLRIRARYGAQFDDPSKTLAPGSFSADPIEVAVWNLVSAVLKRPDFIDPLPSLIEPECDHSGSWPFSCLNAYPCATVETREQSNQFGSAVVHGVVRARFLFHACLVHMAFRSVMAGSCGRVMRASAPARATQVNLGD